MAAEGNGLHHTRLSAARWQQIKLVLAGALEVDPADRAAYLAKACAGDPVIRAEVENLLALEQAAKTTLLNAPAEAFPSQNATTRIGQRVGPYEIFEEMGVGGMGEVYRAFRADDQYKKEVAIKLVRAGRDSRFVVARFRTERQLLANLDHPNIARLLDGGTTDDGLPYFVMELIEGLPINDYCDKQRLPVEYRLKLFLQVCSAVQYAHQRLIVHRDLKPSNILVTGDGTAKLLDFGIAKILGAADSALPETTLTSFRPLTPGYASPEQIKGEPITTASDIYSLGVLLYELLTGHRPYRIGGKAPHEIAFAVCEQEPERPSSTVLRRETRDSSGNVVEITPASVSALREGTPERLRRQLRGDLDNIVLMALRKEPQRRYSSVDQFSTDIRRHIQKLPVSASKDTFRYRSTKFLARHQKGVAAAVALILAILAGLGTTLYEAHRARQNALRAERRFNDVRSLANSLMFEVHDAIKDLAGATPARKLLVSKALLYLQSLSQDAVGDASLQSELADAYQRVGDVQGNPDFPNLGDTAGALASYRQSLQLRKSAMASGPATPATERSLSAAYARVGMILETQGDFDGALQNYRDAFRFAQDSDNRQSDLASKQQLASVYFILGRCYTSLKDPKSALENFEKSAAIREVIAGSSPLAKTRLAGTYSYMSHVLWSLGENDRAIGLHYRAVKIMQELSDAEPANAFYREYLDEGIYGTGVYLQKMGDLTHALVNYRRALADLERLAAADPTEVHTRRDLANCKLNIGTALVQQGSVAAGLRSIHGGLEIAQSLPQPDNSDVVADGYESVGIGLSRSAELSPTNGLSVQRQACAAFQKSADIWAENTKSGAGIPWDSDGSQRIKGELTACENVLSKLER